MALFRHIVVGTLFCLLETGLVDATHNRGLGDGIAASKDDSTAGQLNQPDTRGKRSTAVMRGEGVAVLPSGHPLKALSETPSGAEKQLNVRDVGSETRSDAREPVGIVGDRTRSGQAKERRQRRAARINGTLVHQHNTTGFNSEGITAESSDGENAGSAQVFTSVAVSSIDNAVSDNSATRIPHPHAVRSKVRAPRRSLSESYDSDHFWVGSSFEDFEEELLHMMVTAGLIERVMDDDHYRLLVVRLFETRARSFRENFGRYPNDKVFEHFFLSAEAGTLEDELGNEAAMKLLLYCLHLEARDMTQGYLFSSSITDGYGRDQSDFKETLELFRGAVRNGSMAALIEDEAERYLFYRFFVALQKKTQAEGTEDDLPDADKYVLGMVTSQVLQGELEVPEGRRHIIESLVNRPGILNGLPLPPPRKPGPAPPPSGSSTAPPPPAGPKPESPTPKPPPEPPRSAVIRLNSSAWVTLLLTVTVFAASV